MKTVFYRDKTEYTNQLNPLKGYLEQLTMYISTKKQIPVEQAKTKAIEILKTHFKDKAIKYFEREESGDRVVKDGTLLGYIKENIKNKNILVPTFTSYTNTSVKKSLHSEFISVNVKKRSVAKKAGQKAKADGNSQLAIAKNNEQNQMKIYNNSLSGVYGQQASVLFNPTAHNTLTSVTRTITSLSNASNEKLIAGNRYLPRPVDVLNSVVYTSTYVNPEQIKRIAEKYNLYLPTVEDTVKVLKYSSDLYFHDDKYYQEKVIPYLNNLTPYHLAGICYTGDLYHIRQFNSDFIRTVLEELIQPVDERVVLEDPNIIHSVDESILYYAHSILFSTVKGLGKDYDKMNELGITNSLYRTSKHVEEVLLKYKDFFNAFFMTEVFPTNSHRLKYLRRRTVVLSDTDSTCFTLDEWVRWYKGEFFIDDKSIALAACVSYIASQAIVNQLAIISKSMNVEEELLNVLAMKNEYLWLVHSPCVVSKHYYALTVMQEGNVYKDSELEIKGQILKNSAMPQHVIKDGKELITEVLTTVSSNKKIRLTEVLERIGKLEDDIVSSVNRGEAIYLRKSKVKDKEAYAQDEFKSPYQRHVFWQDVFAPKYGEIEPPPYDVIKIPTIVTSKTSLNNWLDSITDLELKNRLVTWLTAYSKKDLPTIYLNESYIQSNGIPEEILSVIDIKRIIFDTTLQHRTILETLGVMLNENLTIKEQFNLN